MAVDAPIVARLRALAAGTSVEVCGALVGDRSTIKEVWPLTNRSLNARDRFFIPAEDVLRVQRAAEGRGFELLGFYHSHPRGAAVPSSTDLLQAVPGYIYLIVTNEGDLRAWRLRPDRSGFDEVLV
jgi:proteasome lid subunit RPN8/RPN11